MKQVNIAFDDDLYIRMKSFADERDMNVTDLVRVCMGNILPEPQKINVWNDGKGKSKVDASLSRINTPTGRYLFGHFMLPHSEADKLKLHPDPNFPDIWPQLSIQTEDGHTYAIRPIAFTSLMEFGAAIVVRFVAISN